VTVAANVAKNDMVVVISINNAAGVSSCTDSQGNAYGSSVAVSGQAAAPAAPLPLAWARGQAAGSPSVGALFTSLTGQPARSPQHLLHWSKWRRRHQHRAKTSHYQRQARRP
jgi:hypothetical protein